jgi:phage gp36-like protein
MQIAVYEMATTADRLSEDIRKRYEDAIQHLRDIASGKAGLGFLTTKLPETGQSPDQSATRSAYSFKSVRAT